MKIYDCSLFYNELDLLDLRLAELYNHVDHFVIVEATTTFQGNPKRLYLKENWDRYSRYHDKMIHVIVDDSPCDQDAWVNDHFQRNAIVRGLTTAGPDDIVIIGDGDEILRPEVVDQIRANPKDIMGFRTPYFNFKYNYMLINDPEAYCVWITACRRKFLEKPEDFRGQRFALTSLPLDYEDDNIKMYEHAGWHFTYLGDEEFIKNKIRSFAHTEFNYDELLDQINVDEMIQRGVGYNPLDPRPFTQVALDDYFPATLVNNKDQFQDWILSGTAKSVREFLG